ncbi:hypothetical protein N7507_008745 [Penicillium longicatenatum]|nr:hypothetical protein N7507_008745 [Penicillium longicatenatum]
MTPLTKIQAPHQLRYKTEQREVLHWMFKTASSLRKNDSSSTVDAILESPAPEPTCIDIQTLAAFIGKRLHPVPDKILRSFDRVITDRKDTCRDYEISTANSTDPLVKQHNNMHRRWVVGLAVAFDSLGGKEWRARQGVSSVISKTGLNYLFSPIGSQLWI